MVQDFAKLRATTSQDKTPAAAPSNWSLLFTGLAAGLALGVFISFLIYLSGALPPAGGRSDQLAQDAASLAEEQALAQQKLNEDLERAAAQLQLEFYQELPNYEVIVNTLPGRGSTAPAPQPAAAVAEPGAAATSADEALARTIAELTGQAPASDTPAVAQTARAEGVSYMIQAGAFTQETAAINQSQRLNALGLSASVKKEALLGKTLFLVQAGPYESRDQLSQVERILRNNSIDSMRITLGSR